MASNNRWKTVRLGEVCTKVGSGATPRGGSDVYKSSGVAALIRSQNIHNNRFLEEGLAFLEQRHADELSNVVVEAGDVLLNITGDSVARCTQAPSFVLPARVNQHVAIVRPDSSRLDSRFLRYFLVSPAMQSHMLSLAGGGATRSALTKGMIEAFLVPSPPVSIQHRIAGILGDFDDKIELNRRMNETLEAMARALFKSWFVDFDPVRAKEAIRSQHPKWTNSQVSSKALPAIAQQVAELFPDRLIDSEVGSLPEGWVETTIGAETAMLMGYAFKSESFLHCPPGIRLARGDNVKEGIFYWDDKSRYWPSVTEDLERYLLRTGDTLIGMDGSKVGKNWVRVRECDLPCLLVQRVARLRPNGSIGGNAIWILIGDARFREYVDGTKTGTSIPHISGKQIQSYPFKRPPRGDNRLFDHFETTVAPITQRVDSNYLQILSLASARDSLLPRLLSGEVTIS